MEYEIDAGVASNIHLGWRFQIMGDSEMVSGIVFMLVRNL
jgi:hypothetical protein